MRVLGIDPGFAITGLGVVDYEKGKTAYVHHSVISTAAGLEFPERLRMIRDGVKKIIEEFSPNAACVEKLFFQSNVSTAIQVGMARGVILLMLADAGLSIVELTPNEIKEAVAGYGSADKKQIQIMVQKQLNLKSIPKPDDAADALAIAMAGAFVHQNRIRLKNGSV